MQAETAKGVFTPEQVVWLENRFREFRSGIEHGYDKGTIRTVAGGLLALGLAASAFLFNEIGSVRDELRSEIRSVRAEIGTVRGAIGTVRGEIGTVREEISSLREQVQDNRAALARIEAILNERQIRAER